MTFGTLSHKYFEFHPEIKTSTKQAHVVQLDKNIRYITELSKQYQAELVRKRGTPVTKATQQRYQPKDFILLQLDPSKCMPNKLNPKWTGLYEVIVHKHNHIKCRHVTKIDIFEFNDVEMFLGDEAVAKKLAELDGNHYTIESIDKLTGIPFSASPCASS